MGLCIRESGGVYRWFKNMEYDMQDYFPSKIAQGNQFCNRRSKLCQDFKSAYIDHYANHKGFVEQRHGL